MTVVEDAVAAAATAQGTTPRLNRVVIDRPGRAIVIDVHPRLTVVGARAGQEARLVELLNRAATGSEEGIHAELLDETGRDLGLPGDWVWAAWSQVPEEFDPVQLIAKLAAIDSAELWHTAESLVQQQKLPGDTANSTNGQQPRRRRWRRQAATPTAGALADKWKKLAGSVEPQLALSYRPVIEACAATLRRQGAVETMSSPNAGLAPLAALIAQAAAVLCPRPDRLLSVVSFPPATIDEDAALVGLDVLTGRPLPGGQVIVVSSAASVADWARLEMFAGRARWIDTVTLAE